MQTKGAGLVAVFIAFAVAGASGVAVADPIEQEVAGHTVVVTAAEQDTTHNEYHDSTMDFEYYAESTTSGARVDGEGADVTVTTINRSLSYDGAPGPIERQTRGVRADVDGEAAGFNVGESVDVYHHDIAYDFGDVEHADSNHVVATHRGAVWGNGMQVWNQNAAGVGVGEFESPYMNPNPVLGTIVFLSENAYLSNGGYAGPVEFGASGGAWNDAYGGDWNGALVSSSLTAARCYENECQWEGVGVNECVLGLRTPFFFECGLP